MGNATITRVQHKTSLEDSVPKSSKIPSEKPPTPWKLPTPFVPWRTLTHPPAAGTPTATRAPIPIPMSTGIAIPIPTPIPRPILLRMGTKKPNVLPTRNPWTTPTRLPVPSRRPDQTPHFPSTKPYLHYQKSGKPGSDGSR